MVQMNFNWKDMLIQFHQIRVANREQYSYFHMFEIDKISFYFDWKSLFFDDEIKIYHDIEVNGFNVFLEQHSRVLNCAYLAPQQKLPEKETEVSLLKSISRTKVGQKVLEGKSSEDSKSAEALSRLFQQLLNVDESLDHYLDQADEAVDRLTELDFLPKINHERSKKKKKKHYKVKRLCFKDLVFHIHAGIWEDLLGADFLKIQPIKISFTLHLEDFLSAFIVDRKAAVKTFGMTGNYLGSITADRVKVIYFTKLFEQLFDYSDSCSPLQKPNSKTFLSMTCKKFETIQNLLNDIDSSREVSPKEKLDAFTEAWLDPNLNLEGDFHREDVPEYPKTKEKRSKEYRKLVKDIKGSPLFAEAVKKFEKSKPAVEMIKGLFLDVLKASGESAQPLVWALESLGQEQKGIPENDLRQAIDQLLENEEDSKQLLEDLKSLEVPTVLEKVYQSEFGSEIEDTNIDMDSIIQTTKGMKIEDLTQKTKSHLEKVTKSLESESKDLMEELMATTEEILDHPNHRLFSEFLARCHSDLQSSRISLKVVVNRLVELNRLLEANCSPIHIYKAYFGQALKSGGDRINLFLMLEVTEAALDFFLLHLKHHPLGKKKGVYKSMRYTISKIDVSHIEIKRNNVQITIMGVKLPRSREMVDTPYGPASYSYFQAKRCTFVVDFGWGTGFLNPNCVAICKENLPLHSKDNPFLTISLTHLDCKLKGMQWNFEHDAISLFNSAGQADAHVSGLQLELHFDAKKIPVQDSDDQDGHKWQLELSEFDIDLQKIEFEISGSKMSAVYNFFTNVCEGILKEYLVETAKETIRENLGGLLEKLNQQLEDHWQTLLDSEEGGLHSVKKALMKDLHHHSPFARKEMNPEEPFDVKGRPRLRRRSRPKFPAENTKAKPQAKPTTPLKAPPFLPRIKKTATDHQTKTERRISQDFSSMSPGTKKAILLGRVKKDVEMKIVGSPSDTSAPKSFLKSIGKTSKSDRQKNKKKHEKCQSKPAKGPHSVGMKNDVHEAICRPRRKSKPLKLKLPNGVNENTKSQHQKKLTTACLPVSSNILQCENIDELAKKEEEAQIKVTDKIPSRKRNGNKHSVLENHPMKTRWSIKSLIRIRNNRKHSQSKTKAFF